MELGEKGCLRAKKAKAAPAPGAAGGKKVKRPALGREDPEGLGYVVEQSDYEDDLEEDEDEGAVGGKMPGGMDRVEE